MHRAFLPAVLVALLIVLGACDGGRKETPSPSEQPTDQEIRAYFTDITRILVQTYSRLDSITRIFDDSSYVDGLSVNARKFRQGADDLRKVRTPTGFEEEHDEYVSAFDAGADELTKGLDEINRGKDVNNVIASQIDGSLGRVFTRQADACKRIARQAEVFGLYDEPACPGDPYFVEAAGPEWAHRVYVNRCCGGSAPGSEPLEIFYGSDREFHQTLDHYRDEMAKRGFTLIEPAPSGSRHFDSKRPIGHIASR